MGFIRNLSNILFTTTLFTFMFKAIYIVAYIAKNYRLIWSTFFKQFVRSITLRTCLIRISNYVFLLICTTTKVNEPRRQIRHSNESKFVVKNKFNWLSFRIYVPATLWNLFYLAQVSPVLCVLCGWSALFRHSFLFINFNDLFVRMFVTRI